MASTTPPTSSSGSSAHASGATRRQYTCTVDVALAVGRDDDAPEPGRARRGSSRDASLAHLGRGDAHGIDPPAAPVMFDTVSLPWLVDPVEHDDRLAHGDHGTRPPGAARAG